MSIGILAYGSLIDDPGAELAALVVETRTGILTPFRVEYARSSRKRDGGPTLIPLDSGGQVQGALLVLKPEVTLSHATDVLYRREIGRVGSDKRYSSTDAGPDRVQVERMSNLFGIDAVLYTSIPANIKPLTAQELARLAVESARGRAGAREGDGISYLRRAVEHGIITPMTPEYLQQILEITGTTDLRSAWQTVRSGIRVDRP